MKLLVTSRPQTLAALSGWDPVWIQPSDAHNTQDMRTLVEWRLREQGCVEPTVLPQAVDLIISKSQGQFIYTKYLFDDLAAQSSVWSLDQLQSALPEGLSGFFAHTLSDIQAAAKADGAGALWWALRERVLPVLVAARQALSVEQVVWLSGQGEGEVSGCKSGCLPHAQTWLQTIGCTVCIWEVAAGILKATHSRVRKQGGRMPICAHCRCGNCSNCWGACSHPGWAALMALRQ